MTLHLTVDLVNSVPTPTPTPTPSPSLVPRGGGGATTPSSTPAWPRTSLSSQRMLGAGWLA